MVSGRVVAVTVAAVLGAVSFGSAFAQETKPVKVAKAVSGAVLVDNRREANLLELTLTSRAKGVKPTVIAKDLAAGAKLNAKLPAKGGCVYDVAGTFDDESVLEVAGVNLCKDRRLTLVE